MAYYMYVSLQDDDKILVLGMDSATGELTLIADVPAPGGPSSSEISPVKMMLSSSVLEQLG